MPDVLIFDDDPSVGSLVSDVLRGRGLTVNYFPSGAGVVQIVQEARPRLVVLDIMMPGVDGLTACRSIRANPATRHVKIVLLTAKDFAQDRATAQRYGADLFLNKPFSSADLATRVGRMLGQADAPAAAPAAPTPPLVLTTMAGCAALELPDLWIIFDAGKGFSTWLATQKKAPRTCWMLLSRYDEDAVSELPAGAAMLNAGSRVNMAGPDDAEALLQRLAPRLSGGPGLAMRATPLLYPQREGEFQLAPGLMAQTRYTQHPGSCLAYRIEAAGRRVVYCPANEVPAQISEWNRHEREKFRALFENADLLIHGYRRSLRDPLPQDGKARGAWEPVVDLASESHVKQLALLPLFNAPADGIVEAAQQRAKAAGGAMACALIRGGERCPL